MMTCEMTDVYPGEDGMGVEDWCNETAVGRSQDGVRCCEKHAAGLRKEGFRVDPLPAPEGASR
jgi:hypothetical protein